LNPNGYNSHDRPYVGQDEKTEIENIAEEFSKFIKANA